jgi:hypothetical protein
MATRLLIGGPSNSGKSTFVLSLVDCLRMAGVTANAHELDVWSNSYVAFRGEVLFATRPKRQGLDWDWQTPLKERIDAFNADDADFVFGDLPGKLDEAITHACMNVRVTGALVISRKLDAITEWEDFFGKNGVPVIQSFLTFQDRPPVILVGMNRQCDPNHRDVKAFGDMLLFGKKLGGR